MKIIATSSAKEEKAAIIKIDEENKKTQEITFIK
jgi:hypothetical protein